MPELLANCSLCWRAVRAAAGLSPMRDHEAHKRGIPYFFVFGFKVCPASTNGGTEQRQWLGNSVTRNLIHPRTQTDYRLFLGVAHAGDIDAPKTHHGPEFARKRPKTRANKKRISFAISSELWS